jgi:hypothetical protein
LHSHLLRIFIYIAHLLSQTLNSAGYFQPFFLFKMPSNYGQYQRSIYANGMLSGGRPVVTTDPRQLEEQARKALSSRAFNYIAGGAGEQATMDSNRLAFRQWKMYALQVLSSTSAIPSLFYAPLLLTSIAEYPKC